MFNSSDFPGRFRTVHYGNLTIEVGTDIGQLRMWAQIFKVCSQPSDYHQDGARGKIIGCFNFPEPKPVIDGRIVQCVYWVEFENLPGMPVEVIDFRVQQIIRSTRMTFFPTGCRSLYIGRKIKKGKKKGNGMNRML